MNYNLNELNFEYAAQYPALEMKTPHGSEYLYPGLLLAKPAPYGMAYIFSTATAPLRYMT